MRRRRWRILAWALVAVVATAALVTIVGITLPVRHRASKRATVAAPPERVYAMIADVERAPQWRTGVERIEIVRAEGAGLVYREIGSDGAILFAIDEAVPPRRWVSRIADPELPFGGRWVFTLEAAGAGTMVEIVEEGEVYNPVFRFVSRFIIGHSSGIERYLADLARALGTASR